jgi:hypothetical protein
MADLYNKTNYLIYDPNNFAQKFIAGIMDSDCRLDSLNQKEVFYMSYKELLPGYAGLKDEDYIGRFVFIVDFDLDEEFEAMDSNFKSSISDKRVYYGAEAFEKALAYSKTIKNFSFLKPLLKLLVSR